MDDSGRAERERDNTGADAAVPLEDAAAEAAAAAPRRVMTLRTFAARGWAGAVAGIRQEGAWHSMTAAESVRGATVESRRRRVS